MRKILWITILLMVLCGNCFAAGTMSWPLAGDIEITSPYGWRTHPVFGTARFHSGIDLAADFNDPVFAADNGVVSYADWMDGYGNFVIIDHEAGIQSCYGHNTALVVTTGQSVRKGQQIALAGSTGYSTGPHVHFEVRLNGSATDPANFLDGSHSIPIDSTIITGPDGNPMFKGSDADEENISIDAYFDFAKPLRDAINTFSQKCVEGIQLIQVDVKYYFLILVVIDIALSATFNLFEEEWEPINWLIKRIVKFAFYYFLIENWGSLIVNSVRDYFVYTAAAGAMTDATTAGKLVSDPSFIVQKGAFIITPALVYVKNMAGYKLLLGANIAQVLVALALALSILTCYFIIGFQIAMAYLEFYIIASMSVTTMIFSPLKQTKFVAEKGVGALFAVSIKLAIFVYLATIMSNTVKDYSNIAYDMFNYLRILLASLLFIVIGSRIAKTALKLLGGGSPKM